MEALWQDVRYGFRMLLKKPGFTAVAVVALALGIGANTAIFSVVNAVLLKPLPFKEPERVVLVWLKGAEAAGGDRVPMSLSDFLEWRAQTHALERVAFFHSDAFNYAGGGPPAELGGGGGGRRPRAEVALGRPRMARADTRVRTRRLLPLRRFQLRGRRHARRGQRRAHVRRLLQRLRHAGRAWSHVPARRGEAGRGARRRRQPRLLAAPARRRPARRRA